MTLNKEIEKPQKNLSETNTEHLLSKICRLLLPLCVGAEIALEKAKTVIKGEKDEN